MAVAKIIIHDEVNCTITGLANNDARVLYEKYGILIEGAIFNPAVKLGRWDGKIRFYSDAGRTYVRLLDEIIPILVEMEYELELKDNRTYFEPPKMRASEDMFGHIMGYHNEPLKVRPYQVECVNALVEEGSGFIIAGTGAGKSLITAALCAVYGSANYKTITIVPSGDLVAQTVEAFQMCGLDVGEYSGDKKEVHKQHVVATWQSLQNNPMAMKLFQVVIVDEAHGAKADVIKSLISDHGAHIAFRFGVTGTFPKPEIDQINLRITIGSILKRIESKWLIENGYLAKVDIDLIQTEEKVDLPDYSAEKSFLARSEDRIELLARMIENDARIHGNTLVLVNSVPFGRKLAKQIRGATFLSGESENEERQEHYKQFDEEDGKIVVATSGIASTGISIDRIFCLYFIDLGKSFIRAIQSVGRGLRKGRDKNHVLVRDVYSSLKYSKKHAKERIKWYTEAGYPMTPIRKIKYR